MSAIDAADVGAGLQQVDEQYAVRRGLARQGDDDSHPTRRRSRAEDVVSVAHQASLAREEPLEWASLRRVLPGQPGDRPDDRVEIGHHATLEAAERRQAGAHEIDLQGPEIMASQGQIGCEIGSAHGKSIALDQRLPLTHARSRPRGYSLAQLCQTGRQRRKRPVVHRQHSITMDSRTTDARYRDRILTKRALDPQVTRRRAINKEHVETCATGQAALAAHQQAAGFPAATGRGFLFSARPFEQVRQGQHSPRCSAARLAPNSLMEFQCRTLIADRHGSRAIFTFVARRTRNAADQADFSSDSFSGTSSREAELRQ